MPILKIGLVYYGVWIYVFVLILVIAIYYFLLKRYNPNMLIKEKSTGELDLQGV